MRKLLGGRSFFSALREDTRTLADAAGIPQNTAEMIKGALKVGAKVAACLIAAHELQVHATRLLGQAAGEVAVLEREELDELTAEEWRNGYGIGAQNGVCVAWLNASETFGGRVPEWVLADIRRLAEAGQWHQHAVFMEFAAQQPSAGGVDEGQALHVDELTDVVHGQAAGDAR